MKLLKQILKEIHEAFKNHGVVLPPSLPPIHTTCPMPKCKPPKNSVVTLWIVGKYIMEAEKGRAWELMGVYDSEEKAIENCKGSECFIGPLILNDPSSLEQIEWKGHYYPKVSDTSL